jgi:molybdate transport system ATP-binding protein
MTTFRARFDMRIEDFHLRSEIEVKDRATVALLGPNGSGKSSFVRCLAGLIDVPDGEIEVDGVPWLSTAAGIDLEPQQRSIGVVFQNLALFPHMSALANVAYGLRARGGSRRTSETKAEEWLRRLDATHLAQRSARSLSGGEAQKVALARALILEPRLLLLDEPLSSLDIENRTEARHLLMSVLEDVDGVKIIVTHDPVEALGMADRLAIMEAGRIVQIGAPGEISVRPRSRYAAKVAGVNLVRGVIEQRDGLTLLNASGAELVVVPGAAPAGAEAFATFPASAVTLAEQRPEGSARNVFRATVLHVEVVEGRARVALEGPMPLTAEITVQSVGELDVRPGAERWASVKATEIEVYPA